MREFFRVYRLSLSPNRISRRLVLVPSRCAVGTGVSAGPQRPKKAIDVADQCRPRTQGAARYSYSYSKSVPTAEPEIEIEDEDEDEDEYENEDAYDGTDKRREW